MKFIYKIDFCKSERMKKQMIDLKLQEFEAKEAKRLNGDIELIASENYPSQDILDLMGSHFSVKYAEGFSKEVSKQGRHYAGCKIIDELENYAIEQATKLFKCKYANVQPWSGSQANQAVYNAFLKPGDKVLAMDLNSGGHLTHVSKASATGKIYESEHYGLDKNGFINYEEIKEKLYSFNPRLLVVGASAYPRVIDFEKIKSIVEDYNQSVYYEYGGSNNPEAPIKSCYFMVDMAHIAGLVAADEHMSPLPYADVVTSTTHKTLRGPRGGLILWNDEEYCNRINNGVFPKTQGGPNEAAIAAKAQCFIEAQSKEFKDYIRKVKYNVQCLIKGISEYDTNNRIKFVSGGSDNHMVLLDIKDTGLTGAEAEELLASYSIITNKNMISGDTKPSECTGLRLGTAAITTRGFTGDMCVELGRLIAHILLVGKKKKLPNGVTYVEDVMLLKMVDELLAKVGPFYAQITNNDDFTPSDLA